MPSLRRYLRRLRYHARLRLAIVLTIGVACYVVVPPVTRLVESLAGYNPAQYEPKDFDREQWLLQQNPIALLEHLSWATIFNVVLFAFVAALWLTLLPPRAPRRRGAPQQ